MLTLKFIKNATGDHNREEHVYSVAGYNKTNSEDATFLSFTHMGEQCTFAIYESSTNMGDMDEFDVCYIENATGKTIDTIKPSR